MLFTFICQFKYFFSQKIKNLGFGNDTQPFTPSLTQIFVYLNFCSVHFSSQHHWHLAKFNIIIFYSKLYVYFSFLCLFFFFFPMYRVNHCIYLAPLEENIGNIGKQEISLPSASAEPGFFPLSFFFLVLCIFFIFLCSILE